MTQRKVKLKPCPFCGGKPELEILGGGSDIGFSISCNKRKCLEPYAIRSTKRLAIKAWNRRWK